MTKGAGRFGELRRVTRHPLGTLARAAALHQLCASAAMLSPPLPEPAEAQRDLLLSLLASRAYRRGTYTLASGRTSAHYVNCKPVSLSGLGLALLGRLLLPEVEPEAERRRRLF